MNNKDKKTQVNQNAADLMAALSGKTPEEQAALIAASLQAYQEHNDTRVDALMQSQEDMARHLESIGGDTAKKTVDELGTPEAKKNFGAGVVEVITSRPVVIGAGVIATAAVAATGVYVYKKHQAGKAVADTAGDEQLLDANLLTSSEMSKDAAIVAALNDR